MNTVKTIRAKKSLGQNFLIDDEALSDIAGSVIIADRHILEVGPGYGALTEYILSEGPASLNLVELDPDMIDILEQRIRDDWYGREVTRADNRVTYRLVRESHGWANDGEWVLLSLYHQDVLKFSPEYSSYTVIANIPYYITSPILFHFLYELPTPPEAMTIMMQKEVGEKILAGKNKKIHHSYLSLAMELACKDITLIRYVGKESFDPAPKVDSIVLRFDTKKNRDLSLEKKLLELWRTAFQHPRKTFLSNLKGSHYPIDHIREGLSKLGYDERVRAEAIQLEDWKKLL